MALPQLTDEQRKEALEKAAAARHARAELREKIKTGQVTLEEVLDSDDPIAARLKVSALIESLPGYGKAKAATTFCHFRTVGRRKGHAACRAPQAAPGPGLDGFGYYKKSTARRGRRHIVLFPV